METLERFLLVSAVVLFIYFFYKWLLQYLQRKEIIGSFPVVLPFESHISGGTKLGFELKLSGQVRGELLNESGDKVKALFDETFKAGNHEVDLTFDNIAAGKYELVLYFTNQTTRRFIYLNA
jgi:hypothetical protein